MKQAKARWTPEKRKQVAEERSKNMRLFFDSLSPQEREKRKQELIKRFGEARRKNNENDPEYEIKRGKKVSEGWAKRTPEQKVETARKTRLTNPPERMSETTTNWHKNMDPEKKLSRGRNISIALTGREFPGDLEKLSNSVKRLWENPEYRKKQEKRTPSCRSTVWINNGSKNRRLKLGEPLPEGWVYGRTII